MADDDWVYWLVTDTPGTVLAVEHWAKVQYMLLEFQPASRVELTGDPPQAIRIAGPVLPGGAPDIASGILQRAEEWVGAQLRLTLDPPDLQSAN